MSELKAFLLAIIVFVVVASIYWLIDGNIDFEHINTIFLFLLIIDKYKRDMKKK